MDLVVLLSSPQWSQSSLEWRHARALSSRTVAAVSRVPSRGSRDLWLSLEAFPRGFPTNLSTRQSHVPPWWESILGVKVGAVQGKQVPQKRTETSEGLWKWWHEAEFLLPFLWRAPPLGMRWERPLNNMLTSLCVCFRNYRLISHSKK